MLPYVQPDPVLQRKLEEVGLRHCDAARVADRQRSRPQAAPHDRDHDRAGRGAGDRRRRAGRAVAGGRVHGARRRRACSSTRRSRCADDPVAMARAFRLGVEAGRAARLAGLIEESRGGETVEPDHRSRQPVKVVVNGRAGRRRGRARRLPRCSSSSALAGPYALVERNGEPVERERLRRARARGGRRARCRPARRRWIAGST